MALREAYRRYVKVIPTPAAGAELDITPDGQGTWRITHLIFTFTASAVVAARSVALRADDGTTTFWRATTTVTQAALSADTYDAYPGATPAALANGVVVLPMPDEGLILEQGWHLRTVTALIDAGDQYSAVAAVVEEYPSGPVYFGRPMQLWMADEEQ